MLPIKTEPELETLFEKARSHVMTPEEKVAQRKSWVIGELMMEHPNMSREEAELIYERVIGR